MNRQQKLVRDFNRSINTPRRESPGMPSVEVRILRARLILEEALETCCALGIRVKIKDNSIHTDLTMDNFKFLPEFAADLNEAIDGLCDIKYVVDGTADALGVDLDLFFEEVHASNMRKLDGPKDANGKQLKPEGWKPPRIAEMLRLIDGMPQDMHADILAPMLAGDKK